MIDNGARVQIINRLHRKSVRSGKYGVVVESDKDEGIYKVKFDDDGVSYWFDSCNVIQVFEAETCSKTMKIASLQSCKTSSTTRVHSALRSNTKLSWRASKCLKN